METTVNSLPDEDVHTESMLHTVMLLRESRFRMLHRIEDLDAAISSSSRLTNLPISEGTRDPFFVAYLGGLRFDRFQYFGDAKALIGGAITAFNATSSTFTVS